MTMKKMALLLVIMVVISGSVWAQGLIIGNMFDSFYAVPTVSTEARYSAGIFGSMVDNYIKVNYYDFNIGTFVVAGGYPSSGKDITDTDTPPYALNFGLGKTLKSSYLGLYYGGSLLYAWGDNDGGSPAGKESGTYWENRAAVLIGTPAFGAFRLDMILETEVDKEKSGSDSYKERAFAPSFALTWGMPSSLHPYITAFYQFPEKIIDNTGSPKSTETWGSILGLQGGLCYDLSDSSSISGDMAMGIMFGYREKGVSDIKSGAILAAGLRGAYKKTWEFGKLSMGFSPKVALGFILDNSSDYSIGGTKVNNPAPFTFELGMGLDLGLKYQMNRVFGFYTGAGLQLIDFISTSYVGGDIKNKSSSWNLLGVYWDDRYLTDAGRLGFGMTFEPIKNLVIGTGLNSFLDRIVAFNLAEMRIENAMPGGNNFLYSLFGGLTFDLTVSYKF